MRKLGIPTVLDRFIQQAVMQFMQRQWDPTFPITVMVFGRDGRLIRQWPRRSSTSLEAAAGWWILIWKNSSIESITTN